LGFQRNTKTCRSYDLQVFFIGSIHLIKIHKKYELNGEFFFILHLTHRLIHQKEFKLLIIN